MLDYTDFYDPDFGYDAIISDETAKTLEKYVKKGTSILDIGCGTGRVSSRFRANKITLLDQSKKYLEIASKKVNLENMMQGKFLDLNIDKKFDNIFILNFIHEQENTHLIIEKATKLLETKGKIFISFPNSKSLHRLAGEKMSLIDNSNDSISDRAKNLGTLKMIKEDIIKEILVKNNLEVTGIVGICFKPYPNEIMEKLDEKIVEKLNQLTPKINDYSAMKLLIVSN
tara:strand:- start:1015 stop:1698 length:684 start_codon:yes stop_codon:yes gene_type:complete